MTVSRLVTRGVFLLSVLVATGCGASGTTPPTTYPVSGKVLFANGKPVRHGLVSFHPEGGLGVEASVSLESDGTFVLKTYGDKPGTVPGRYKVSINPDWPSKQPADAQAEAKQGVPRAYWSADTTKEVVEVKAQDNVFEIKLR